VNKVKRVVNCSNNLIPNHWSSIGIQYLSFQWTDDEINQVYLNAEICEKIFTFIEEALRVHDSVIIHGIGT
jgi:protein-tyrosine phosphatase